LRCIQITSTEMGDSTSANPGSPCCIPQGKRTATSITQWSHRHSTHLYQLPPPLPVVHPPAPVRSLHFLLALPLPCHIPTEYKYTTHLNPSCSSFTCL
jgi:hypothetical protein